MSFFSSVAGMTEREEKGTIIDRSESVRTILSTQYNKFFEVQQLRVQRDLENIYYNALAHSSCAGTDRRRRVAPTILISLTDPLIRTEK